MIYQYAVRVMVAFTLHESTPTDNGQAEGSPCTPSTTFYRRLNEMSAATEPRKVFRVVKDKEVEICWIFFSVNILAEF